ncbi:MAG: integration host factor subunit alpha [Hyphomonadaceae bacterium]
MDAKTVTRADLVETVAEKTRLSRTDSARIVTRVFELIEQSLVNGENVKLSRFGNFVARKKRERVGRNPKTGLEVPITPRTVVTFRPSQLLKERVEKGAAKGKPKKSR